MESAGMKVFVILTGRTFNCHRSLKLYDDSASDHSVAEKFEFATSVDEVMGKIESFIRIHIPWHITSRGPRVVMPRCSHVDGINRNIIRNDLESGCEVLVTRGSSGYQDAMVIFAKELK